MKALTLGGAMGAQQACIKLEMVLQECRQIDSLSERQETMAAMLKKVDTLPTWGREYIQCRRDDLARAITRAWMPTHPAIGAVRALAVMNGIYLVIWSEIDEQQKGGAQ